MSSRIARRSLMHASIAGLAALSLSGCIPTLGARKRPVVNIGVITFPQGFNPSSLPLYKAALAVTKAHADDYDINVNTITVAPPTPAAVAAKPPASSKASRISEPPQVAALEQALDQDPPPDVVLFDSSFEFGYALQKNLLQPIDSFVRSDSTFKQSDYFPGAVKVSSDQGQLFGIPLSVQPTVLQYDKRLFDAAHLDPPSSSWTWTTFLNAAKVLTRAEGDGGGQYALNLLNGPSILPIFIWQNGGDLISPDGRRSLLAEPAALEAIKFMYDLCQTYKVVALPPRVPPGSNGKEGYTAVGRAFAVSPGEYPPLVGPAGLRVAMNIASFGGPFGYTPFGPGGADRPIRLAELPRGKEQATMLDLNGILALTQKASDPKAAFQVMALLAREMHKQMNIPAYRPAAQNLSKTNPQIPEDDARVLIASLEYARALPVMAQPILGPLLFQNVIEPIQQGEKSPEEIARDASQKLDEALNE